MTMTAQVGFNSWYWLHRFLLISCTTSKPVRVMHSCVRTKCGWHVVLQGPVDDVWTTYVVCTSSTLKSCEISHSDIIRALSMVIFGETSYLNKLQVKKHSCYTALLKIENLRWQLGEDINFITLENLWHCWSDNLRKK